jgi:hypothetical protein
MKILSNISVVEVRFKMMLQAPLPKLEIQHNEKRKRSVLITI